jgi:hypothetical protein
MRWAVVRAAERSGAGGEESSTNPLPAGVPDEIIVTGERVSRSLKDTPSSAYVATQARVAVH